MIRQTFEFRHERAQIMRPRRRFDVQRRFDGPSEGDAINHCTVAGGATSKSRRALKRSAGHQRLDAFVHIAEAFLEPGHGLARSGEAEMSWLDNARMNRSDRDLMQVLA